MLINPAQRLDPSVEYGASTRFCNYPDSYRYLINLEYLP